MLLSLLHSIYQQKFHDEVEKKEKGEVTELYEEAYIFFWIKELFCFDQMCSLVTMHTLPKQNKMGKHVYKCEDVN